MRDVRSPYAPAPAMSTAPSTVATPRTEPVRQAAPAATHSFMSRPAAAQPTGVPSIGTDSQRRTVPSSNGFMPRNPGVRVPNNPAANRAARQAYIASRTGAPAQVTPAAPAANPFVSTAQLPSTVAPAPSPAPVVYGKPGQDGFSKGYGDPMQDQYRADYAAQQANQAASLMPPPGQDDPLQQQYKAQQAQMQQANAQQAQQAQIQSAFNQGFNGVRPVPYA